MTSSVQFPMSNILIVLILYLLHSTTYCQYSIDCPKSCGICLKNVYICDSSSLSEIPSKFPITIENITFVRNRFSQTGLYKYNLSGLKPPINLKYFSIRSSNLQVIHSSAFDYIKDVRIIDLSDNQILEINDYAFEGLDLEILMLNGINNLKFHPSSFEGLQVKYLFINHAYLRTLDYNVFSKLPPKTLYNLSLVSNTFHSIDSRFNNIFKNLQHLNLTDVPLVCDCDLLWLKYLSSNLLSLKIDFSFPKCISPSALRGRTLLEIDQIEFKCYPPKITELHFNLINNNQIEIKCHGLSTNNANGKVKVSLLNASSIFVNKQYNQAVTILKRNDKNQLSNFKCEAENNIGKSVMNIGVKWPLIEWSNKNVTIIKTNTKVINSEITNSVNKDKISLLNAFYFKKRYTLVELIIAIISTFFCTIVVFFLIYRICILKSCSLFKYNRKEWKYINNNNPNIQSSNILQDNNNHIKTENQYIHYRAAMNNNNNTKNNSPTDLSQALPSSPSTKGSLLTHHQYPMLLQQSNDAQSLNIIMDTNSQTYDCISVNNNHNNSSTLNSSNNALFTTAPPPIPPPPSSTLTTAPPLSFNGIQQPPPPPPPLLASSSSITTLPRSNINFTTNHHQQSIPHQFIDYKTHQRLYNTQI